MNNTLATIDSNGEILEAQAMDAAPDMAISLEESGRRIKLLQEFVRQQMREGEDYGVIPGTTKPTLYKPGAEKLNAIYGLSPHVAIVDKTVDIPGGYVAYEVKVSLVHKASQRTEAEGVGSCNSMESRYKNKSAADLANTILKMAKKRALVDATLSATRCSGLFTQDLEDGVFDDAGTAQSAQQARPTPPRPKPPAGDVPSCPRCGGPMWDNREKKASGEMKENAPDFKCKNKECKDERGYVTATWADSGSNARREVADLDDRMQQAVHEPARANGHSNGQAKLSPIQELVQYADSVGMNNPTPNELLDILKRQGADFRAVNAGNLAAAKVHVDNFLAGALPDNLDAPWHENDPRLEVEA